MRVETDEIEVCLYITNVTYEIKIFQADWKRSADIEHLVSSQLQLLQRLRPFDVELGGVDLIICKGRARLKSLVDVLRTYV